MDIPEDIQGTSITTASGGHRETSCEKHFKGWNREKKKLWDFFDKRSHLRVKNPNKRGGSAVRKRRGNCNNVNTSTNHSFLNEGQNAWNKGK